MHESPYCPACGTWMTYRVGEVMVTVSKLRCIIKLPGEFCSKCGESILEGRAMEIKERIYKLFQVLEPLLQLMTEGP